MYGYIYVTTNIVNGKQYIGQHKAKEFDKRYKGSGKILQQAILKEGVENFTTTILEWCESKEELDNAEIKWIDYYSAVESDNFYNIYPGGNGIPEGFIPWNKGKRYHLSKPFTKERCLKIKNATKGVHKGNVWIHSSLTNENKHVKKDQVQKYLSLGWKLGRDDADAFRKMSESQKLNPNRAMLGRRQSDYQRIMVSKKLSGVPKSITARDNMRVAHSGKILVSNESLDKSLYIMPDELDYYISLGYHRGRRRK